MSRSPRTFAPEVRLESYGSRDDQVSYAFDGYVDVVSAFTIHDVLPAFGRIEDAAQAGLHAAGFVCYEAATAFDEAMSVQAPVEGLPLVWFALYRDRRLIEPPSVPAGLEPQYWKPSITNEAFEAGVDRIQRYIRAGDTYQVNYTHRLLSDGEADPRALYRQLTNAQRADYAAYIDTGRFQIVSASPELFFQVRGDRIVTRPMKGTRPRGPSCEEDDRLAAELSCSEKDRAENLMIVDLLRNDLGRICEPGSIHVRDLWTVERYETVLQMTSEIGGRLGANVGITEIMKALFPCGSVTGAPKVRTMEIIRDLECSPRGIYTGAIGTLSPDGDATFSVGIRTVCVDSDRQVAEYGVGGGITHDSSIDREYAECVTKARVLTTHRPEFSLFETMRYDPGGGVYLLDRHLERMARSAEYFRFPFDREGFEHVVEDQVCGSDEILRIRVTLSRDGDWVCERQPWPTPHPMTAVVSDVPIDSRDPFLYHKTTNRAIYESQYERYRDVARVVILKNERGELTECLVGNVVVEFDGRYYTPPVSSGLLAGTFRDDLLARGEIEERILERSDVEGAEAVYMINSIREWVALAVIAPGSSRAVPRVFRSKDKAFNAEDAGAAEGKQGLRQA